MDRIGQETCVEFPSLSIHREQLITLAQTRNRIIHFGFTPKDTVECARLLLSDGFPFLIDGYRVSFGIDLWTDLAPELGRFLRLALVLYAEHLDAPSPHHWFAALGQYIGQSTKY